MCKLIGLMSNIIMLLSLITEIASMVEFTNVKCTSWDNAFDDFEYCHLKSVNRSFKYLSLKVNLHKLPITKVKVNFSLLKRYNGYKPFLYNITVDACKALRHPKSNPIFNFFHGLFKKHSNMNHTCSFNHDLIVEKLPTNFMNQQVSGDLKFPHGDYLFHSDWYAYGINRATVDFFYSLS
ncbi:uncharacterized protein LOC6730282 isoform X3 [Drosophila simulans]|uniref:uncharacterized protein LOC6730282 isoform X3 n=2 Tax=Drosophila simulans TaxID=7240 RepID=UPI00078ADDBF|nr:uncharacterized protein LOC6730282 isoform X3 [Drosophila simulans]KMZ06940.1 uncharacterized protein Dsimw501_GD16763 [Drosophila simulans]